MFVTQLDLAKSMLLKQLLLDLSFELSQPPYTLFVGKKPGISCALYASGKLVVQGKESREFLTFYLEPQILQQLVFTYPHVDEGFVPHIGIDEAGKGDVFGPLCVAGVYVTEEQRAQLQKLGVKDSKKMSDKKVLLLAKEIKSLCVHRVLALFPNKYNQLYQSFANLNALLAWGHATVIEDVVGQSHCRHVTIDQFAAEHVVVQALKRKNVTVELTQRHRAEEDVVVAAASILARGSFLEGLDQLSRRVGLMLPKGAAHQTIAVGKELVRQHDSDVLAEVMKLHFKTRLAILDHVGEEL